MTADLDRGLVLRRQALALLEQAMAADGLKPFVVSHHHAYGSASYMLWSSSIPDEPAAVAVLQSEFEPERNEWISVEEMLPLHSLCGAYL